MEIIIRDQTYGNEITRRLNALGLTDLVEGTVYTMWMFAAGNSKLSDILPNCSFGKRCVNIKYGDEYTIIALKQYVKDYFNSIL